MLLSRTVRRDILGWPNHTGSQNPDALGEPGAKRTALTGADVQHAGQGAVPGGLRVRAETPVVWVDGGGGQRGGLEGVTVHLDPFQVHALLEAG